MSGTHYVGLSGQLAVMSEVAYRGYNVAIPLVDAGDDIFSVKDSTGQLWRIQVKTANPRGTYGNQFTFNVKESQIKTPLNPDLIFVWCMRNITQLSWDFVVLPREVLRAYVIAHMGTHATKQNSYVFQVYKSKSGVRCSQRDLSQHLNDFATWPTI